MIGALNPQTPGSRRKAVASMLMNQAQQRFKSKVAQRKINTSAMGGSRPSTGTPFKAGRLGQTNQFILPMNRGSSFLRSLRADHFGGAIPQLQDWFSYGPGIPQQAAGVQAPLQSIPLQSIPMMPAGTEVPMQGTGNPFTGGAPGGIATSDPEQQAYITGRSDINPFQKLTNPILAKSYLDPYGTF